MAPINFAIYIFFHFYSILFFFIFLFILFYFILFWVGGWVLSRHIWRDNPENMGKICQYKNNDIDG